MRELIHLPAGIDGDRTRDRLRKLLAKNSIATVPTEAELSVKLIEWVKIALCTCYVKTAPVYDFKLVYTRLSKNFSKRGTTNKSEIICFIHRVVLADLEISLIDST